MQLLLHLRDQERAAGHPPRVGRVRCPPGLLPDRRVGASQGPPGSTPGILGVPLQGSRSPGGLGHAAACLPLPEPMGDVLLEHSERYWCVGKALASPRLAKAPASLLFHLQLQTKSRSPQGSRARTPQAVAPCSHTSSTCPGWEHGAGSKGLEGGHRGGSGAAWPSITCGASHRATSCRIASHCISGGGSFHPPPKKKPGHCLP